MSAVPNSRETNLLNSSMWGIARGISVHALLYPLDVTKIRQQCQSEPERSYRIARAIFKNEGIGAFYRGLFPHLLRTSIKPAWAWPMITAFPDFLNRHNIRAMLQQALTGWAIATIDAAITTPLEKAKILSASTGKVKFSFRTIMHKEGWQGWTLYWAKLSVNWSTFLVSQQYLRDRYRRGSDQALSLAQLTGIGTQTALIVSLAAAPFDIANTRKQAQNLSPSYLLSGNVLRKLYRGWPLNAFSLTIHNVVSVILIDKLSNS